ncbi:hypothetical protein JOL62DRAFT_571497 [Phyllosticta paracitricarpa]|uniref:Secreted protein n=1 Tax=Phyllosticta paracitricarpa TaxID=2016321 RepID=A0ABR1ND80_9PEZI
MHCLYWDLLACVCVCVCVFAWGPTPTPPPMVSSFAGGWVGWLVGRDATLPCPYSFVRASATVLPRLVLAFSRRSGDV